MESASTSQSHGKLFFADRPVKDFDADVFDRKGFVRSFWKALRNHNADEAVVIGITGSWGDGKTTFKDMVVDLELKQTGNLAFW